MRTASTWGRNRGARHAEIGRPLCAPCTTREFMRDYHPHRRRSPQPPVPAEATRVPVEHLSLERGGSADEPTGEEEPTGAAGGRVDAARLDRMVEQRTQELLHLQDARARERRLAAVGQLAAGVMHDVNNALNPIMAAAHLLMLHADDPETVRDYAMRIAKAAETGAATAARVGRFIRQEPQVGTHDELTDLSVIADEVIAMTRPVWSARALGGHVELRRELADGALTRGMPTEAREALINLVQNALDAMATLGGGTLGIATYVERREAIVEVSDSGHGMTPEVCERAFEPFFTTKGSQGTGLGLSEVYGIMKRHRGHAEIVSSPGVGTTVRLVFPLATALTPSGEFQGFLDRVPKRVLLVEPETSTREALCRLLIADGHVVDEAGSVAEALSRIEEAYERLRRYDLLLTALSLPDAEYAQAVVNAARARWEDIRVGVVLPSSTSAVEGVARTGADFTIHTPIRPDQLLALIGADS